MGFRMTHASQIRDQVFISYSHKDTEWMDKFSTQLKVIQQTNRLDIWSDEKIAQVRIGKKRSMLPSEELE